MIENTPKRTDVLCSLSRICKQLEKWANSHKPVLPIRVTLLRAAIYGYSALLSGLKEEELELRIVELEETLKDGILIERDKTTA